MKFLLQLKANHLAPLKDYKLPLEIILFVIRSTLGYHRPLDG